MTRIPRRITALISILCVLFAASAQAAAQSRTRQAAQVRRPAIVVISDQTLQNYAIRRNSDLFAITIFDVGNFRTISAGQPFEQQQPAGTNNLVISFQLQTGTHPQVEQNGKELSIFFQSVSLPSTGMPADMITTQTPSQTAPLTAPPQMAPPRGQTNVQPIVVVAPAAPNVDVVALPALDAKSYIEAAPSPDNPCSNIDEPSNDNPRAELLVVDANTGDILEGATRVGENTRVRVVFVNKNPFKYDYSFRLVPKDIGSATITSFLSLIPGLPNIPGILEGTITPATEPAEANLVEANAAGAVNRAKGPRTAGQPSALCDAFAVDLNVAVKNSKAIADALKESAAILKKGSDAYATFLKGTSEVQTNLGGRQRRVQEAKILCGKGLTALPSMRDVVKFKVDDFSKDLKLDLFAAHVIVLENDLASAGCDQTTKDLYAKVVNDLKNDVTNYKAKLEELKKGFGEGQKKLEAPTKLIQTAVGSPASFVETAYAPSLHEATSVSITITRKNLRDEVPKDEVIAVSPPVQIGEPRVLLSAGIGFSSINERKVIREPSLVPDGNGGTTVGNRFGFENRSQFRPSGVVMINGVLKRFDLFGKRDTSFALSGGLVFSDRTDGLATEFIAGPSLGFANNRMFLTLGFHAARVEELSGGFKIGDPVPSDLADPLPVQKNWLNGLIMSITFRINP